MTANELFQVLKAPHTAEQEANWLCTAISEGMDIGEIRDMLDFLECCETASTTIGSK